MEIKLHTRIILDSLPTNGDNKQPTHEAAANDVGECETNRPQRDATNTEKNSINRKIFRHFFVYPVSFVIQTEPFSSRWCFSVFGWGSRNRCSIRNKNSISFFKEHIHTNNIVIHDDDEAAQSRNSNNIAISSRVVTKHKY